MIKKKKIIIFYNNDLRSKIVYSKVLIQRSKDISCIVEVPSLYNSKVKYKFIFNYLKIVPLELKIYYLVNYLLFPIIASLWFNKLSDVAKKNKIKVYKYNYAIEPSIFCKINRINTFNKIFIYGTPNIIKVVNKKLIILNIHDADPEKYRGLFCHHRMMINNDVNLKTAILKIDSEIDKGDILLKSINYKINNLNFFDNVIISWKLNCENIIRLIDMIDSNFKFKKNLNLKYVGLDKKFLEHFKQRKYKLSYKGLINFIWLNFTKNTIFNIQKN